MLIGPKSYVGRNASHGHAKLWVNGLKNGSCTINSWRSKVNGIDAIDAPLDGLPIKDLMFDVDPFEERATRSKFDVDPFEERATRSNSSKRRGNSENSITHMKERVEELDITQNIIVKLLSN